MNYRYVVTHVLAIVLIAAGLGLGGARVADAAPESWPNKCVSGDKQAVRFFKKIDLTGQKRAQCGSIYAGGAYNGIGHTRDRHMGAVGSPSDPWEGDISDWNDETRAVVVMNRTLASNYPGLCFAFFTNDDFWPNGGGIGGPPGIVPPEILEIPSSWAIWVEGKPAGSKYRYEIYDDIKTGPVLGDSWARGYTTSFEVFPADTSYTTFVSTKSECLDMFDPSDVNGEPHSTGVVWN